MPQGDFTKKSLEFHFLRFYAYLCRVKIIIGTITININISDYEKIYYFNDSDSSGYYCWRY